jgi:hypothetical protein
MIYGHIERWIAEENPSLAEAVDRYYSVAHGTLNDAAIGEIAARKAAGQWRARRQGPDDEDIALVGLLAKAMFVDQAALERGDSNYFRRLAAAVAKKGRYRHRPVEYVFEAYLYLRRRAGQGSPLPNKRQVKQIASLIWAFKDFGIMRKLPEYLWRNTGLSPKELATVAHLQEQHLASKNKENWSAYLAAAGLKGLRQARRSKK